jgi:hypothetical protein
VRHGALTVGLLLFAGAALSDAEAGAQLPPRTSAVLSLPSTCVRTRTVRAIVTGREIERVSFMLDGRRVKVLTRPNDRSRWVYRRRTRTLSRNRHRVVARVSFTEASGRSPANLRGSFRRCARR